MVRLSKAVSNRPRYVVKEDHDVARTSTDAIGLLTDLAWCNCHVEVSMSITPQIFFQKSMLLYTELQRLLFNINILDDS